jgi:ubiquitin-like protein Pup
VGRRKRRRGAAGPEVCTIFREVAAMSQEQKTRTGGGDDDDAELSPDPTGQERREKLSDDVDDVLDEIDEVLESNAEDFVRAYVQKGGQ